MKAIELKCITDYTMQIYYNEALLYKLDVRPVNSESAENQFFNLQRYDKLKTNPLLNCQLKICNTKTNIVQLKSFARED